MRRIHTFWPVVEDKLGDVPSRLCAGELEVSGFARDQDQPEINDGTLGGPGPSRRGHGVWAGGLITHGGRAGGHGGGRGRRRGHDEEGGGAVGGFSSLSQPLDRYTIVLPPNFQQGFDWQILFQTLTGFRSTPTESSPAIAASANKRNICV